MNKILNWTFGACFRTLGRFLAIFIVFVLLLLVGSKLDLELPSWLALNVNASETNNMSYIWAQVWNLTSFDNKISFTSYNENNFNFFRSNQVGNVSSRIRLSSNNLYHDSNFDYYYFLINIKNSNNDVVSNITSTNSYLIKYNSLSLSFGVDYSDHTFLRCNVWQNYGNYFTLQCPNLKSNSSFSGLIVDIQTEYENSPQFTQSFDIGISRDVNISTLSNSSINNALNNQNQLIQNQIQNQQQTNEKLDDMNQTQEEIKDSITNDSTTGAEDSASGFFNDFTTETFGLTSIITSPLNAINSLINSTCNNLVLPLPYVEKNLTLPCMNSIYSNYFKGFFDLYQIITTGLISYYIIVRIFNLVKDFKNPEHDEIEVMDL